MILSIFFQKHLNKSCTAPKLSKSQQESSQMKFPKELPLKRSLVLTSFSPYNSLCYRRLNIMQLNLKDAAKISTMVLKFNLSFIYYAKERERMKYLYRSFPPHIASYPLVIHTLKFPE